VVSFLYLCLKDFVFIDAAFSAGIKQGIQVELMLVLKKTKTSVFSKVYS